MDQELQALEERVAAVTTRLALLRGRINELEGMIGAGPTRAPTRAPGPAPADLVDENRRLLGERTRIRARVRELIEEIDRVL